MSTSEDQVAAQRSAEEERKANRPFGAEPAHIQDALEAAAKKLATMLEKRRRWIEGDHRNRACCAADFRIEELGRSIEALGKVYAP